MKLKKTFDVYTKTWLTQSDTTISIDEIDILRKVIDEDHITILRLNDGEWIYSYEIEPHFSNHLRKMLKKFSSEDLKVLSETSKRLKDVIESYPEYPISIDVFTLVDKNMIKSTKRIIEKMPNKIGSGVFNVWCLHTAFEDLFSIFDKKYVILVAPNVYKDLPFRIDHHIETDFERSIFQPDITIDSLNIFLSQMSMNEKIVIIYSCSFTAKLCIDDIYQKYPKITQLDMGAILAPFVGLKIRPWHESMIEELKELNIIYDNK